MSTDPSKPDFDPLLALYSIDVEDTPEGVTVYDNLATFESNMQMKKEGVANEPGTSKKSEKSFSKKKKVIEEARNRDLGKLKELMQLRKQLDEKKHESSEGTSSHKKRLPRKLKSRKTLLTSMEKLNKGPYSVVYKLAKAHLKCNVYTRDFCGLRGVCSGYIVAFDRYLNLALVDVDETFRKPPLGKVASHQKSLTISELNEATQRVNTGEKSGKVAADDRGRGKHQSKSGRARLELSKNDEVRSDRIVKIVGPRLFNNEVFHGGGPQLYHRHVAQLLVRGDSIVIVTECKQGNAG